MIDQDERNERLPIEPDSGRYGTNERVEERRSDVLRRGLGAQRGAQERPSHEAKVDASFLPLNELNQRGENAWHVSQSWTAPR